MRGSADERMALQGSDSEDQGWSSILGGSPTRSPSHAHARAPVQMRANNLFSPGIDGLQVTPPGARSPHTLPRTLSSSSRHRCDYFTALMSCAAADGADMSTQDSSKSGAAVERPSRHLQPTFEARVNGSHAIVEKRLAALEVSTFRASAASFL